MRKGGVPYDKLQKTNMYTAVGDDGAAAAQRNEGVLGVAKKKKKRSKKPKIDNMGTSG